MDSEECSICGLELNEKYTHELSCGHKFHYECLMKTFAHTPKKSYGKKKVLNSCPYCRKDCDYLPVVNGLKKLIVGVHFETIHEFSDENGISKSVLITIYFIAFSLPTTDGNIGMFAFE